MAFKAAAIYGAIAAAREKLPPGSPQAQFYTDIAQLILDICADADVVPTALVAPSGGGAVTGKGSLQ